MKKIWTLTQIAKAWGVSKQWTHYLFKQGRLKHDIEDIDGNRFFSKLPKRPEGLNEPKKRRGGSR